MISAGLHLVDIRTVASSAIPELVVSRRGAVVVSRYEHSQWNLSPYIHTRNTRGATIRFDVEFHDGSVLTDERHARLLESAKRFLYARWRVKAPHSGKHISAKTLCNNWSQLRALLRWMVLQGVASFAELSPEKCLAYASGSEERLKDSSRIINLQILTTYYHLRDYLEDRLPEYPWGSTVPILLARKGKPAQKRSVADASTEVIPTRILQIVVQKALDYIENRAERLLDARDQVLVIRDEAQQKLIPVHRARYPHGFASAYEDEETYLGVRIGHLAAPRSRQLVSRYGLDSLDHLKEEIVHLRTACHIVCAVFSGMRDSELASLEVGCFSQRKGFDGEEFCWLKGTTYKLEEDPKPAEWMVPELVGKAVAAATRLGEPYRAATIERIAELEALLSNATALEKVRRKITEQLDECRRHQNALLTTSKEKGRTLSLGGAAAAAALHKFVLMSGAVVTQQDMEGVRDHEKVVIGEPWPLAPHQFRRTFAVFVARNLMGDVRYLREHFKHWSIDMTLYYAKHEARVDHTVFEEILSERDELQALILERWIHADAPLSGGGGKRIIQFRNRGDVKTVSDMREFCRKLGEDVFVRGTGHSWCLASGSGCGGQGLYDAVRCTACGEGVIDENNIQVWRGIRQQQIEVLTCPDLGVSSWQRCVDHLRTAERILIDLGDQLEPYPVPPAPSSPGALP